MGLIRSFGKAMRLLQALDAHGGWMGVRELPRTAGMTSPSTRNLLKTFRAKSFVEANSGTKQYRLGLASIRMGEGSDSLISMRDFCLPYVKALANEFDEIVCRAYLA
jgi:DNA-binding IclR family transcriptional regulator